MPKNCISIYNEFSNIGPMRMTWTWRIKVNTYMRMGYEVLNSTGNDNMDVSNQLIKHSEALHIHVCQ